jgi:CelD/BcsL family acetyltransferase involved in cellulose biosynthesis
LCTTAPNSAISVLSADAFEELACEWDALLGDSYDNRLFLTPRWQRIWWRHFGDGDCAVLARWNDDGSLAAVLPLHVTTDTGARVLSLVGDFNVFDYMDAAAMRRSADELLVELWCEALRVLHFDTIALRHVPASSPLVPALRRAAAAHGLSVIVEADEVCPVALLCSTWDGYLQMLSKKQRHEIRRKLRRASENTTVEWRTTEFADTLDADLDAFFALHERSTGEKAAFLTPRMRGFFRDVAREYLRSGELRLSTLELGGVPAASSFGFMYRDRYLLYNSGFEPSLAERSPGNAAVAHAMQGAIAEGAVAFDFLSGDEAYKYAFGAQNTFTARVTAR